MRCIDTDTTNSTLLKYQPLQTEYPQLSEDHLINPRVLDQWVETISAADAETRFVVDVGSNSFQTLMAYDVENGVFDLLAELGSQVLKNRVDEAIAQFDLMPRTRIKHELWGQFERMFRDEPRSTEQGARG